MDNKQNRRLLWVRWQRLLGFVIIFLLGLFVAMIIIDKKFPQRIKYHPFEGEVGKYNGSLQRNLANPLGSE